MDTAINPRVVLTGGPGAGKTSVIQRLKSIGYLCVAEVGRRVIQQQVASQGSALPWADKVAYRDAVLHKDIENHRACQTHVGPVFFDRGIVDSYGYSCLEGLSISHGLRQVCRDLRYCQTVFLFPPWRAIFTRDSERKQRFDEAIATHDAMRAAYIKFGYTLIEVPKGSVEDRVNFLLESVCFIKPKH